MEILKVIILIVSLIWAGTVMEPVFADSPCDTYVPGNIIRLESPKLDEISGLARGLANDVLWGHTDSGGKAELYALDWEGHLLRTVPVSGAGNVDWEDIASGPCDPAHLKTKCLYVADLGDNRSNRTDKVIYVIEEQKLPKDAGTALEFSVLRKIPVSYPAAEEGTVRRVANPDSESIMVDPRDGGIYIISKQFYGDEQVLYRVIEGKPGTVPRLERLAGYMFSSALGAVKPLFNAVTGADFSPDGKRYLVRTYAKIYEYDVSHESVAEAFVHPRLGIAAGEIQGESVVYSRDGKTIYTASENYPDVSQAPTMRRFTCVQRQQTNR